MEHLPNYGQRQGSIFSVEKINEELLDSNLGFMTYTVEQCTRYSSIFWDAKAAP